MSSVLQFMQAPQVRFDTRVNLGCVGQNGVVSLHPTRCVLQGCCQFYAMALTVGT